MSKTKNKIYPVILSGGSGTRLWPLSRKNSPKQFLKIIGEKSLFTQALERVSNKELFHAPIIVTNKDYLILTKKELKENNITDYQIILEPSAQNTAPAITAVAHHLLQKDDEAIFMILASDHKINDNQNFYEYVNTAYLTAKSQHLVSFGIKPKYPETGYGYIAKGKELNINVTDSILSSAKNIKNVYKIKKFIEKPKLEDAKKLLSEGSNYWNSGMFMFSASLFIKEIKKFEAKIYETVTKAYDTAKITTQNTNNKNVAITQVEILLNKEYFSQSPKISVDYAVMEKTTDAAFVPADIDWTDLGSWQSIYDNSPKDKNSNVLNGDIFLNECKNSLLFSNKNLLVGIGLENISVVQTEDATIVVNNDKMQNLKATVDNLAAKKRKETIENSLVYRPWGTYKTLATSSIFNIKEITVYPAQKLSLQSHKHRSEHWTIIQGLAEVTKGNKKYKLSKDESIFIEKEELHRIENIGTENVIFVEVQTGTSFAEDDIVRYEDDYGRI